MFKIKIGKFDCNYCFIVTLNTIYYLIFNDTRVNSVLNVTKAKGRICGLLERLVRNLYH